MYIKKNNYGYDVDIIDENEKGIISVIGGNVAAGGSGRKNWNGEIPEGELKGLLDLAMDEAYDYFMEGMDERLIIGVGESNSKLKVIIKRVETHGEVDYCIEAGAEQNALKSFLLGMAGV